MSFPGPLPPLLIPKPRPCQSPRADALLVIIEEDDEPASAQSHEHEHEHSHRDAQYNRLLAEINSLKIEVNNQLSNRRLHSIEERLKALEDIDLRELLKATQDHDPKQRARKLLDEISQLSEVVSRRTVSRKLSDA